ncbi:MaoC/PaaZ C-terminal domain-containing protein [Acinetobacter colistiniresistens]|uniref:MaoC family dehydratase n=1 Tax=Acinetobacter colistiniresistens TaxID=280145 RepID=UPI00211C62F1|nr:MaoC/PaaZ C-terminal domain-containing protein [Acinetobacter colistiniresistens]UUM26203.1 MaoC/PaaZ C-terminal domain-containing protein [Acinetobacter colistiniresistens]
MNTRHFSQLPKPYLAYPKVIQGLIFKKPKGEKVLPQVEYVVDTLKIDSKHLESYNEICGFKNDGFVPAIYLAVLSQSLQMHMMTSEAFPFPILGLVHIRNQIKQTRKITVNEQITLSCKFGELKPHDKGLQFDFITTAKVGSEVVMESLTTYLSRQKTENKATEKAKESQEPAYQSQAEWNISENTGRRYAVISGDFNLIHIHAVTAKAFGFKQAIAHGMWSKAKALASIELPAAYEADVWFKLPMYLPSTVEFLTAAEPKQTDFLIRNVKSKKPHVAGTVKAL